MLGSFYLRAKDLLLLDLRSCERALLAIEFFDERIPRSVARVTEAEVVNKLYPATGNSQLAPDSVFDHQQSTSREIDRLPVHYYEDGIHGFELALRTRQIVARQHWLGNLTYSLSDAVQAIMKPM